MTATKAPTPTPSASNGTSNGSKITTLWACIFALAKEWGPGAVVAAVATWALYYGMFLPQLESQMETRATNGKLIEATLDSQKRQTAAWEKMVDLQEGTANSQNATTAAVSANRGLNEQQLNVMEDIRTQNAAFQTKLCEDHKAIMDSVEGVKKTLPVN